MTIKLILSDIDGTILNDNNEVDSDLKQVIKGLKNKDIPFVLASARSPKGMLPIAKELDVLDNPIACYNGALVIKDLQNDKYSTILSHELNVEEVKQIIKTVHDKYSKVSINLYSGSNWYAESLDKWVKIESGITNLTPILTDFDKLIENNLVHKILLVSEPDEISVLLNDLERSNYDDSSFYLSKPNYLEITNSQISKEKALRELTNTYNLSLDQTMTLGDNYNDISMLKIAGLGVAMENAPTDVKDFADAITEDNNKNGVSKAIKKYVLR